MAFTDFTLSIKDLFSKKTKPETPLTPQSTDIEKQVQAGKDYLTQIGVDIPKFEASFEKRNPILGMDLGYQCVSNVAEKTFDLTRVTLQSESQNAGKRFRSGELLVFTHNQMEGKQGRQSDKGIIITVKPESNFTITAGRITAEFQNNRLNLDSIKIVPRVFEKDVYGNLYPEDPKEEGLQDTFTDSLMKVGFLGQGQSVETITQPLIDRYIKNTINSAIQTKVSNPYSATPGAN